MPERIDIFVPESRLAQNAEKKERLAKTERFEETDRAPVVVDMQLWSVLAGRGGRFSEMTASPREHLRGLILNWKYRYENICDDLPIDTDSLTVEQDFGAIRGVEFPMEVVFRGDDQPKTVHLLRSIEDIDRLSIPDPYSGHNKMRIDWYRAMSQMVEEFDVRLNGERLELKITINHQGGPIPSAFALCGSNLFLWMALDPDRVHRLMEIVTASHLQCIEYIDELNGVEQREGLWLGCDTGEMMSAAYFSDFVAPYYRRIFDHFSKPHVYHMCGKINHILEIIRADIGIDKLDGFGFPVDPEKIAARMGGKVVLRGGPHPVLIHDGPIEEIISTCSDYIGSVGQKGGYILSEGFGVMAGTPPQHIDAMVEASKRLSWVGGNPAQ